MQPISGRCRACSKTCCAPIEGERVVVHGAGRTDAGVHAMGQVVSFTLTADIRRDTLQRALNATLPGDVRVLEVEEAPDGFNSRFDARRKTYHFTIFNAAVVPPHRRHFVWHVPQRLDVNAMGAAAAALIGEYDFSGFQAAGGDVITSRRELFVSRVEADPPEITYEVTGSGFLRHMVRNIVGTLVDIGLGRRPVDDMRRVLESRDRSQASPTAPPHGLTLWSVGPNAVSRRHQPDFTDPLRTESAESADG